MAESVTISTYLELKDNLSAGLADVANAVRDLHATTKSIQADMARLGSTTTRTGHTVSTEMSSARASVTATESAVNALNSRMADTGATATRSMDSFRGGITGAIAGANLLSNAVSFIASHAVDAVKETYRSLIDLNRGFENTGIRIAGTLKAFNVAPTFEKAKQQASDVMMTIQSLAAALPGETADYITVFAQALPKAIASGLKDTQAVAEFTSRYTAVAVSNMVDSQQAGMDLFRMLSGQAGADVRMWTVLAEKINMTAEQFNKLDAVSRRLAIADAISAYNDQLIEAGNSFDAIYGEMSSRLDEIKRIGGEVLFEKTKDVLRDINGFLKNNKYELEEMVGIVGTGLSGAFSVLTKAAMGFSYAIEKAYMAFLAFSPTLFKQYMDALDAKKAAEDKKKRDSALQRMAAPQAAAEEARVERRQFYQARHYEDISKMLPAKLARQADMLLMGSNKMFGELVKLGKAGKVPLDKLQEYAEFMGLDEEMLRLKVTGAKAEVPVHKLKQPHIVQDFRHSRFDIRQDFAEGFDPDRIAVAFASDLGRLAEFKVMASTTQTGVQGF